MDTQVFPKISIEKVGIWSRGYIDLTSPNGFSNWMWELWLAENK